MSSRIFPRLRPSQRRSTRPGRNAGGRRSRPALLVLAGLVVGAGLLLRSAPGVLGDVGGGILYTVLVFLLVAVVAPAWPAVRIGVMAFLACVGIELLQFTGLPTIATDSIPALRYVLGSTFVASDLLAYAAGAFSAVVIDRLAGGRASDPRRRPISERERSAG